jgi:hypothetical protein
MRSLGPSQFRREGTDAELTEEGNGGGTSVQIRRRWWHFGALNWWRRVFRFGYQNRWLRFGHLGLKIITAVSWFWTSKPSGLRFVRCTRKLTEDERWCGARVEI